MFCLYQILDENEVLDYYVDGRDMSVSNWMRYVNCAVSEHQQNMIASQFQGQIYYRLCQDVEPRSELFVWYGAEYAAELGLVTSSMIGNKHVCIFEIQICFIFHKNTHDNVINCK